MIDSGPIKLTEYDQATLTCDCEERSKNRSQWYWLCARHGATTNLNGVLKHGA